MTENQEALDIALSGHIIKPDAIAKVADELIEHRYIGAIKQLRAGTVPTMYLKEAKMVIDCYARRIDRNPRKWAYDWESWTTDATTVNETKNVNLAVELEKLIALYGVSKILKELGNQV